MNLLLALMSIGVGCTDVYITFEAKKIKIYITKHIYVVATFLSNIE